MKTKVLIKNELSEGKSKVQRVQEIKKMTASNLFLSGNCKIGENVLEVVKVKEDEAKKLKDNIYILTLLKNTTNILRHTITSNTSKLKT